MGRRTIILCTLVLAMGLTGCRRSGTPVSACGSRATGPLTPQDAKQEALRAVKKEVGRDHTCSISSITDDGDVYTVCVRIDPPPSSEKKLPEHWTVEIPKTGVSQTPGPGGG